MLDAWIHRRKDQIGSRNPTSMLLVKAVSLISAETSRSASMPLTIIPLPTLSKGELRVDANTKAQESENDESDANA